MTMRIIRRKTLPFDKSNLFRLIEDIEMLSLIKKEIGRYTLARNEPGLQIVDTTLKFPFFIRLRSRLKYTTIPGRRAELKQIKGFLKSFECGYALEDAGEGTSVIVQCAIKFPYGIIGYFFSLIYAPLVSFRLSRELRLMEKYTASQ